MGKSRKNEYCYNNLDVEKVDNLKLIAVVLKRERSFLGMTTKDAVYLVKDIESK
jgi:hypothetical protein